MLLEWYRAEDSAIWAIRWPKHDFRVAFASSIFNEILSCDSFLRTSSNDRPFPVSSPLGLVRMRWSCRPGSRRTARVRPSSATAHHIVPELHHAAGGNPSHDHQHPHVGERDPRHH